MHISVEEKILRCASLVVFVRVPENGKCYISAELFSFEGKEKMVILFICLLFVKSFLSPGR